MEKRIMNSIQAPKYKIPMNILCATYRDWGLEIYNKICQDNRHRFNLVETQEELENKIEGENPDLVLTFGWSNIIPQELVNRYPFVCLHPSPLPKYRGGSPIQNQIIRGVKDSAVTLFYMDEKIDHGPIINQKDISLRGHLDDIFKNIISAGVELTNEILDGKLSATPQNHTLATYFKRRKPEESEISYGFLRDNPGEVIFDFMRALEDPYPNPFFIASDGSKLLIKRTELKEAKLINHIKSIDQNEIKLKDFKKCKEEGSAIGLYEKIISKKDPFIICADGKKLYLEEVSLEAY
jgi:methionyl-tRNA formyltransferase